MSSLKHRIIRPPHIYVVTIFVYITSFFCGTTGFAQGGQLAAMKRTQRIIQPFIEKQILPQLLIGMTEKEREATKSIIINVVLDERLGRVVAFKKNGKKTIEISTGFLSLISSLIDAKIVAVQFNKADKLLQYQTEISNFLNSAEAKWGVNSPQPFSRFVGILDNDYQSLLNSKKYWPEFEETIGITLSFVIAHEFGHHIFEHQAADLTQQRRNEDEADDFAIRVNWMIGNNPLLALDYFMLFTQVEGQIISAGRTHTASACRLEKFMDAGIKFTRSEPLGQRLINGNPKFQEYLQKIQEGQRRLKEMCEKGEAMPSSGTPFLK